MMDYEQVRLTYIVGLIANCVSLLLLIIRANIESKRNHVRMIIT